MYIVVMSDLEGDWSPEDVGVCKTEAFAKLFCKQANSCESRWNYEYYELKELTADDLHT